MNYIYRDIEANLTQKEAAKFLQAIAKSGASIICTCVLKRSFPDHMCHYWTMLFRLRFDTQADLDKLHSLGFQTRDIPTTGQ